MKLLRLSKASLIDSFIKKECDYIETFKTDLQLHLWSHYYFIYTTYTQSPLGSCCISCKYQTLTFLSSVLLCILYFDCFVSSFYFESTVWARNKSVPALLLHANVCIFLLLLFVPQKSKTIQPLSIQLIH